VAADTEIEIVGGFHGRIEAAPEYDADYEED
jgi:hypothetical protein